MPKTTDRRSFGCGIPFARSSPRAEVTMNDHAALKQKAALVSIVVSVLLTSGKLAAGLASGSLALLSEAANNLADVATTIITYWAIRVANKPADDNHQFGHGKVEALAALIETGFLFAMASYILVEAIARLTRDETAVEPGIAGFAVLVISIAVDLVRWRSLDKIAKATKSDALAADALHFSSDIVSSGLALLGLLAAHYGYPQGDTLAALGVAGFIAVAGYSVGRRTVDTLLDAAPPGLARQIEALALETCGVIEVETLRLRPAGGAILGEMTIKVARTLPVEELAAIKSRLAAAIETTHPDVTLTITVQPIALDDETVVDRVLLAAARRRLLVHHFTVQDIGGRTSVSFDVELDGHMAHADAHETVSRLEQEVRRELGADIEVETHIEPLDLRQLEGHDAAREIKAEIARALNRYVQAAGTIRDVHDVRVRDTPAGLVVNYHCRVDPSLSVEAVHAEVDALERNIRANYKEIARIVGHAEPARA
jgi:cation diffusion facilitator family transporter